MNWWSTNESHAADLTSWVKSAQGHADFPIQNLPLGVFSPQQQGPRIGTAIGDAILDLTACASDAMFPSASLTASLQHSRLNALMALPSEQRQLLRHQLSRFLSDPQYRDDLTPHLYPQAECIMHLPAHIGDFTDFYVGLHHAENIGRQFRPDNPLLPNYKHIPIGYHGRASSVRPSGVEVRRPSGQRKGLDEDFPRFEPSQRLDYELELGVWIGEGNELGQPIAISNAARHFAGLCLLNDWSARDFQAWEYQPLGPFLAKNFHSSISPWLITAEALAPYRIAQPPRAAGDPSPLPYLTDSDDQAHGALAIQLSVHLLTEKMRQDGDAPALLSQGPASNMYWTIHQIITHHASNGCNLMAGDLLGTGTISAPDISGFGSLMELSAAGKQPFLLPYGEQRSFVEDGDEVILRAFAAAPGFATIGFGECRARVLPAL